MTIPDLDEGSHTIKFVKQMFELTKTVIVKANEITKVDAVLQLSKENLNVFSTPTGASVSIDGRSQRGLTPITVKELSVGQHKVIITKDGYEPHEAQINIEKNKTNQYSANLIKEGRLIVSGKNINGTDIEINSAGIYFHGTGKNENFDNVHYYDLPNGNYSLKISKDGYVTHEENFSLILGEEKSKKIDLVLVTGSIQVVNKYPDETVVKLYYKSYSKGWTEHLSGYASDNINWSVTPKTYQLRISCSGYLTLKKDIKIIGNDKITISDPLESNEWVLKEIKSLKMKRNVSFVLAGVIAGTGGLLRSLSDKQYTDYQKAGSNADELRDKVETTDSLTPLVFGTSGISLGLPLYFHSKIGTLTKMLSE